MSEEKLENNNEKKVRNRRTNSQVKRTNTSRVNKNEGEKKATRRTARVGKRNIQKEIFKPSKLKIIPLGGLHEIGKNITVFEYENEMIVVDCGLSLSRG